MNLVMPILGEGAPNYDIYSIDDSSNGGSTFSFLDFTADETILVCEILPDNTTYSFCEIAINVVIDGKGIDLSSYDSITVELGFRNSTHAKVRLQTKNNNPAYSLEGDSTSDKFNIIEFNPAAEGHRQTIPLSYFQVPEWWVSQYDVPIRYSQPEFSNTTIIEVSVGTDTPPGEYELWVKEMTVNGKLISYTHLLTLILCVWIFLAIVVLIGSMIQLSSAYRQKQKQIQELNDLNEKLNIHSKKMEQQAKTDALTGLLNRSGVAASLLEFQTAVRHNKGQLSVIFCDVDLFKQVNDTYGHGVGDQVIVRVASLLEESTRADDLVVRWGGEEFVLFCPQTSLKAATKLAEKLRIAIELASWPNQIPLTASFGVAQMTATEDIDKFLHRADLSLYRAKGQGRNRVEISSGGNL